MKQKKRLNNSIPYISK